jgi:hypothetical protein
MQEAIDLESKNKDLLTHINANYRHRERKDLVYKDLMSKLIGIMKHGGAKQASDTAECTNCGVVQTDCSLMNCSRCKLTMYCSKSCQKQHWRQGHKRFCLTEGERTPTTAKTDACKERCAVCFEGFSPHVIKIKKAIKHVKVGDDSTLSGELKCGHKLHFKCIRDITMLCMLKACPLCRVPIE